MPRTRWLILALLAALAVPAALPAQEAYQVRPLKEAPPPALAGPLREALAAEGFRVVDTAGKPLADVWLRKAIPASARPGAPKGNIQFPVLAEGELLGALRFPAEGHDYRDQPIAPGAYTLRYGLQPLNGDHLGVSPFRDYALLVPAARETAIEATPRAKLERASAEASGSNHPAILFLLAAPATGPAMIHDEAKATWGLTLPLSLTVAGQSASERLGVQLIVVGKAGE